MQEQHRQSEQSYWPKLIIWDGDGTLWNTREHAYQVYKDVMPQHGYSAPSHKQVDSIMHSRSARDANKKMLMLLNGNKEPEESVLSQITKALKQQMSEITRNKPAPMYLEAVKVLQYASDKEIKNYVVSDSPTSAINSNLDPVKDMITKVIGNDEDGQASKSKNPAGVFDLVKKHHKDTTGEDLHPDSILVVGDSRGDMMFAHSIQARFCYASYGFSNLSQNDLPEKSFYLENIGGLISILQAKNPGLDSTDEKASDAPSTAGQPGFFNSPSDRPQTGDESPGAATTLNFNPSNMG